ncbi:MAG: FAD-binding oxidoreductase [Deltaproteobacteria bacterium]|nr:FAD-binding oxidoreductase [Deltaproteobacteria bacterium]
MAVQKNELEKIVGSGNVLDDEATLIKYSRDQSFVPARKPDQVVYVGTAEQIQEIVRLANTTLTPVVPYSSGLNQMGATIPDQGGIVIDMSRMNKIIAVDEENWYATIEPGVTFAQLQDDLAERGFRCMVPFGAPEGRSVLTSYLERDPVMAAANFETGNTVIMDTEVVLPDGDIFRTGNWASGGDPGSPAGPIRNRIYRMFTAAQGTLGIMTKMVVQIEPLQKLQKIFFIPFKSLADAIEPIKQIQRREIGNECYILNNVTLAAMLTESWQVPESFPSSAADRAEFLGIKAQLPNWTMTICINGHPRRPEEKIAYESEALKEVCDAVNVELLEGLPNIPGAEHIMLAEILRPWSALKKFNLQGSVQPLKFKSPLKKIAELEQALLAMAQEEGYPAAEISMYLLPMERARAVHCEFDLHCPAADGTERDRVKALWLKASADLINRGAYFDRPYGAWADMMYARAANYTDMLRKLKAEVDPNNVLNPGKLCFS